MLMFLQPVLVPGCSLVLACILDKRCIASQIHGHRLTTDGTAGNELMRDAHVLLLGDHTPHGRFIVIGLIVAGLAALPETIISLRIEQPLFGEAILLEEMIDIRGQDEIILILYECQQCLMHHAFGLIIPIAVDLAAPIGPIFFRGGVRIKSCGIHVLIVIPGNEVRKILLEALTSVGIAGSCRKSGTGADEYGICFLQQFFEPCQVSIGWADLIRRFFDKWMMDIHDKSLS